MPLIVNQTLASTLQANPMAGNALGTPNKASPWTAWYPESAGRSAGAPLDLISADVRLDGREYSRVTSSGERPETATAEPGLALGSIVRKDSRTGFLARAGTLLTGSERTYVRGQVSVPAGSLLGFSRRHRVPLPWQHKVRGRRTLTDPRNQYTVVLLRHR